jgi:rhomboid protease GluP
LLALAQLDDGARYERSWGHTRFLIVYLVSAVGGSLLSTLLVPGTLGVGASGALLGLIGARQAQCFVKLWSTRLPGNPDEWSEDGVRGEGGGGLYLSMSEDREYLEDVNARDRAYRWQELRITFCQCALIAAMSFIPLIDWAAHLGGYVTGLLLGFVLYTFPRLHKRRRCRFFILVLGGGSVAGIVLIYSWSIKALAELDVQEYEFLLDVCAYYKSALEGYECSCIMAEDN